MQDRHRVLSLLELGERIQDSANSNNEILDIVQWRLNKNVISGYEYDIHCEMKKDDEDKSWTLKASPVKRLVGSYIKKYAFPKRLFVIENIFGDDINYELKDLSDLERLNQQLLKLGMKYYGFMPDTIETRRRIEQVLQNMEHIEVIANELKRLTMDCEESVTNDKEIRKGMSEISSEFDKMKSKLNNVKLTVSVKGYNGYEVKLRDADTTEGMKIVPKATDGPSDKKFRENSAKDTKECEVRKSNQGKNDVDIDEENNEASISGSQMSNDSLVSFTNLELLSTKGNWFGHSSHIRDMIYFEHESRTTLVTCSDDGIILLWDMHSNKVVGELKAHEGIVCCLAFYTLNGDPFLASGGKDIIKLWNLKTKEFVTSLEGHEDHVGALITFYVNDIPYLASGSADCVIRIWNLKRKKLRRILKGNKSFVTALATYQYNGDTYLASGGNEDLIKLWNLDKKNVSAIEKVHTRYVTDLVALERNAEAHLASASADTTIKIWNASDKTLLTTFTGHSSVVKALGLFFHKDVLGLVSGDCDGNVRFWNAENYKTIEKALGGKDTLGAVNSIATLTCDSKSVLAIGCVKKIALYSDAEEEYYPGHKDANEAPPLADSAEGQIRTTVEPKSDECIKNGSLTSIQDGKEEMKAIEGKDIKTQKTKAEEVKDNTIKVGEAG